MDQCYIAEVSPGVVLDFDDKRQLVGIDIDQASKIVDLCQREPHQRRGRTLTHDVADSAAIEALPWT